MNWFVKKVIYVLAHYRLWLSTTKGDMVKERKPMKMDLIDNPPVSKGHPRSLSVQLLGCRDPKDLGAPDYKDDSKFW